MAAYPHSTALTDAYRERKADKRTELVDAKDEISALRAQLAEVARYDWWIATGIETGTLIAKEDGDIHPDLMGRLQTAIDFLRHRSRRLTAQGSN